MEKKMKLNELLMYVRTINVKIVVMDKDGFEIDNFGDDYSKMEKYGDCLVSRITSECCLDGDNHFATNELRLNLISNLVINVWAKNSKENHIVLTKLPCEEIDYDFEEEIGFEELKNHLVIFGNDDLKEYGRKDLIDIVENSDDVLSNLKKATNEEWEQITIRGSVQREWQNVYYSTNKISEEMLDEIEAFYFGEVDKYLVGEDELDGYSVFIPCYISWKGIEAICDYIGVDKKDVEMEEKK